MEHDSDLNIEMALLPRFPRKTLETRKEEGLNVSESEIVTDDDAAASGRRKGYYVTVSDDCASNITSKKDAIIRLLSRYFEKTFKKARVRGGKILVAGLGNAGLTADALGAKVLARLKVGKGGEGFEVCTLAPMVGAVTGVESFDVIRGVCDRIEPACVVAVDALATYTPSRLCSCYQITDAGISPGSGVGDVKKTLCREHLGRAVVAVGVPFVARASAIAEHYASKLLEENSPLESSDEERIFLRKLARSDELIVTPKDVDDCVDAAAEIIAAALNNFFF